MSNIKLLSQEIWRDISDYKGLYQISSSGKVMSLDRTHVQKNGRIRKIIGKAKILQSNIDGYNVVHLYKNSRVKVKRIAVLVLENFKGERPNNNFVAMHLDNNKTNDFLSNLKWGTHSENVIHSVQSKTHYSPNYWAKQIGILNSNSRIIFQKTADGNIVNKFYGAGEASRATGISKYAISQNAQGKSKMTRSGYVFAYE